MCVISDRRLWIILSAFDSFYPLLIAILRVHVVYDSGLVTNVMLVKCSDQRDTVCNTSMDHMQYYNLHCKASFARSYEQERQA